MRKAMTRGCTFPHYTPKNLLFLRKLRVMENMFSLHHKNGDRGVWKNEGKKKKE